ncbi:hypothetical protein COCNU_scaffold001367G000040 [Cocos nucifera]|nr:hypothetical protein [Cocos nucifera]
MLPIEINKLGHYLSISIESANNNKAETSKALKEAEVAKAKAFESKAEVEHLKEVLKEVERNSAEIKNALETDLASEIEKRKKAEAKINEVKRKGEKRVTEAKQLAMVEFKASKELTTVKV